MLASCSSQRQLLADRKSHVVNKSINVNYRRLNVTFSLSSSYVNAPECYMQVSWKITSLINDLIFTEMKSTAIASMSVLQICSGLNIQP